jgi:hypothetical protein
MQINAASACFSVRFPQVLILYTRLMFENIANFTNRAVIAKN